MRVEAGDHAGDGVGDQLLLVDRLDVVALDHAEHGGELLQLLERQRATELRAMAWSCIVANAPATAPSANQPATFNLTPMNDPFDFRPAARIRRCRTN